MAKFVLDRECEFRMFRYTHRLWLLQENADLTFVEARIYLHKERCESLEKLSKEFDIEITDEYYEEIVKKVEEIEKTKDIFLGYTPLQCPEDESEKWKDMFFNKNNTKYLGD